MTLIGGFVWRLLILRGEGWGVGCFFFPPTSFLFSTEIPHQCLDL